ncbi:MAG: hypothetical protein E6R03_10045 [Hyphomicrobiaceae bacterium]|nr:MAG: hypothetical protein E6R03_10045 [Hyphomicrobiaceae bacterium]
MSELVKELRFLADSRQQMGYDRTGSALDQSADRIEKLEAALREIAAEAYVSDDYLQPHNYPNGWRKVAVDRIDIARAALKEMT